MSSNDPAMEAALLEIAKDLLQASDDLASSHPTASAKLAHEAYEIARDLGVVKNNLDDEVELGLNLDLDNSVVSSVQQVEPIEKLEPLEFSDVAETVEGKNVEEIAQQPRVVEDASDEELFRFLDRQRALLTAPLEDTPIKKPSRSGRSLTFESAPSKRSSWFGWMHPREWRHAG